MNNLPIIDPATDGTRRQTCPFASPRPGIRSHRRPLLPFFLSVALIGAGLIGCSDRDPRPNVILISIDSLRADHLKCYGYERDTSPRIDALASEGALFEHAFSTTSWTLPSHMALFTSLYDTVHGVTYHDRSLDPMRQTMPELFKKAGYSTAGFFSGPYLIPIFGFGRGFDKYIACFDYMEPGELNSKRSLGYEPGRHKASHSDITTPRLYQNAMSWLESSGDEPYFLFLHMWDVHYDYIAPAEFGERFADPDYESPLDFSSFETNAAINPAMDPRDLDHLIALYDGEISYTDDYVGRILDRARELDRDNNTIVILLSDHGEAFFEHGSKGHQKDLYDEVLRIPLIFSWPGRIESDIRFEEQVSIIDILPTLAHLTGIDAGDETMGRNLGPVLLGDVEPGSEESLVFAELTMRGQKGEYQLRAVRTNDYKVVFNTSPGGKSQGKGLLYDLRRDPKEQTSLGAQDAEFAEEAVEKLNQIIKRTLARHESLQREGTTPVDLPPEVTKHLEALGYIPKPEVKKTEN